MATSLLAAQVGALLTEYRNARAMSRRELATEMGLSDVTLLDLESGRANPTLRRLEDVGAALGIRFRITAEGGHRRVPGTWRQARGKR